MNYHHKVILQSSFESKSLHCDRFNLTSRLETACHESSPQSHCKTSHCVTKRLSIQVDFQYFTKKGRNQLTCSGISQSLCLFSEKECVNDREQKKVAKLCISSVMKLLFTQILLFAGVAATKIIIISVECSSVYKNVVSNFTSSQISAFHVWKLSRSKQILLFQFHLGF